MDLSGSTRLLGVIGHPIRHTLSPQMHNAAFAASGLDYVYLPMEVRPVDLAAAVGGARALGFRGFNVTMPHKEAIIPILDDLDRAAEVSGAVNTVVIEESGLRGANTDVSGFVYACREAAEGLSGGEDLGVRRERSASGGSWGARAGERHLPWDERRRPLAGAGRVPRARHGHMRRGLQTRHRDRLDPARQREGPSHGPRPAYAPLSGGPGTEDVDRQRSGRASDERGAFLRGIPQTLHWMNAELHASSRGEVECPRQLRKEPPSVAPNSTGVPQAIFRVARCGARSGLQHRGER